MMNPLILQIVGVVLLLAALFAPRLPLWTRVGMVLVVGGGLLQDTPAARYSLGVMMMGLGVFFGGSLARREVNEQVLPPQIPATKPN
jgi:hypothetical protein